MRMKFLILLFYHERPEMLERALMSVKNSTYENWDLAVIDDGTDLPGIEVIEKCFTKQDRITHRVSYVQTFDSKERKLQRGGSQFGEYANSAIRTSDADIVLMLCDDDLLIADYLEGLNDFYTQNPLEKYSYSHLRFYDPSLGSPEIGNEPDTDYTRYLNSTIEPINPARRVDSSQVSWRISEWLKDGMKFPSPKTSNLDEAIFEHMYVAWGGCPFNGLTGQWKGIHKGQLVNQSTNE